MPDYRAFVIGADGHIQGSVELDCASDDEAIERAKQLADDNDIELWERARKIATFDRHT